MPTNASNSLVSIKGSVSQNNLLHKTKTNLENDFHVLTLQSTVAFYLFTYSSYEARNSQSKTNQRSALPSQSLCAVITEDIWSPRVPLLSAVTLPIPSYNSALPFRAFRETRVNCL